MGYFNFGVLNFCYRLWRSKKFRKFVIGFGFLAFVLSTIISNTTFAAQSDAEYTTDTTIAILESYQRNVDIFVKAFNKTYNNNTFKANWNNLFNYLQNSNQYLYLRHYSIPNDNLNCLLYSKNNIDLNVVNSSYRYDGSTNDYMLVPCTGYNVIFSYNQNISLIDYGILGLSQVSISDFVPSVLIYRMPSEIVECMEKAGYTYAGPIVDIKQQIADMKETQEDIKGDLEKTERTPEEQAEQEQEMQDLSDSVISVAESGEFNSLITNFSDYFERLSTTLTYNESKGDLVTFRLPFVNKDIILTSNYLERFTGSFSFPPFGTFKNFVQSIWFVVFGALIGRLIWRIVSYFTSGEFLNDEGYKTFRGILSTNLDSINPLML